VSRDIWEKDSEYFPYTEVRYQEGSSLELDLAGEVVREFLKSKVGYDDRYGGFPNFVLGKDLISGITSKPQLDGQDFLDAIIMKLEKADEIHQQNSDFLLSPLIGALYDGEDRLTVDYQRFYWLQFVARRLMGTAEKPLFVNYLLPEDNGDYSCASLGEGAKHCKIAFRGTKPLWMGKGAKHCSFHMQRVPSMLGYEAYHCTFYLEDVDDVSFSSREEASITYVNGTGEINFPDTFFVRGNQLLIPDGKGWQKVWPEV